MRFITTLILTLVLLAGPAVGTIGDAVTTNTWTNSPSDVVGSGTACGLSGGIKPGQTCYFTVNAGEGAVISSVVFVASPVASVCATQNQFSTTVPGISDMSVHVHVKITDAATAVGSNIIQASEANMLDGTCQDVYYGDSIWVGVTNGNALGSTFVRITGRTSDK
jgi:hypothetical protein